MFLLKTLPKTRTNYFWNPCRRYSARSESRSRSRHLIKKTSWITPGRESSVLMKTPVFSYHVRKFFAKIPTWWMKFDFSRKKNFPKGLTGHVECSFNIPAELSAGCSKSIKKFSLLKKYCSAHSKTLSGWNSALTNQQFFSRNPEIYRQNHENDKFFTPTGQIVFAYSPNVMTKSYTVFPKNFFRQIFFRTIWIHV